MQQDQNETRALSPKNTPSPVNTQPPIAATEKLKVTSLDDGSNLETGLPYSSETSAAIAPDAPAIANTPSPTQGQREANEAFAPWEREASLRDSVRGPRCNRSLIKAITRIRPPPAHRRSLQKRASGRQQQPAERPKGAVR